MKSFAKLLVVGVFAVAGIAVSAAPSEAAKKKAKAAAPCNIGAQCSTKCSPAGACQVQVCGHDRKWYQAVFTPVCHGPLCPPKC